MKKKTISNKGITLIALVITIIVLLILAGISIAMLTGENGILTKADTATKETEIAEAKEQAKLDIAEWIADQLEKGNSANISDSIIQSILTGKEYVGSAETDKFTTKKKGYEIPYADLYNRSIVSKTPTIPEGFYVVPGLDKVEEGFVISDVPNDTGDVGNQFVWIPVTSESEYVRNKTYNTPNASKNAIDDTNYLPTGVEIPEGKTEGEVEKEAGKEGIDTLVCKKGATVWNEISQEDAKEKAKTFKNTVKSGLITGIQWDVTMAFISKEPRTDGEGNVYDVTTPSSNRHTGDSATTGQNKADQVCNIYDLEGNLWEYSAEKITSANLTFILRGGSADITNRPASHRYYFSGISTYNGTFRLVLYV